MDLHASRKSKSNENHGVQPVPHHQIDHPFTVPAEALESRAVDAVDPPVPVLVGPVGIADEEIDDQVSM
jgi:hypothetical protein